MGGFDSGLPIMEDLDLVLRLHMAGPLRCAEHTLASAETLRHALAPSPPAKFAPDAAKPHSRSVLSGGGRGKLGSGGAEIGGRMAEALRPVNMDPAVAARVDLEDGPRRVAGSTLGESETTMEFLARKSPSGARVPILSHSGNTEDAAMPSTIPSLPTPAYQLKPVRSMQRPAGQQGQKPQAIGRGLRRTRGRIRFLWAPCRTSGRRLSAWGNVKGTYIHFMIATQWYFGATPAQIQALYDRLYTDNYR